MLMRIPVEDVAIRKKAAIKPNDLCIRLIMGNFLALCLVLKNRYKPERDINIVANARIQTIYTPALPNNIHRCNTVKVPIQPDLIIECSLMMRRSY